MLRVKAIKVVFVVNENSQSKVLQTLEQLGIRDVFLQNGRNAQMRHKSGLSFLLGKNIQIENSSVRVIHSYVLENQEDAVLGAVSSACNLDLPGYGSAWSCDVDLLIPEQMIESLSQLTLPEPSATLSRRFQTGVAAITCVVQRGQGELLAKVALELGTCVPLVLFGQGTGLRDKLGLLRITINAAKEVVQLLVPQHDSKGIMKTLIEEAKLDRPGQGFISLFYLRKALLNTQIHIGQQEHVASMEQVIGAIDVLAGNTFWRKRYDSKTLSNNASFLTGLEGVDFYGEEDRLKELVQGAMHSGASGATSNRIRQLNLGEKGTWNIQRPKEQTNLVISPKLCSFLINSLSSKEMSIIGEIQARPLSFTYNPSRRS